MKPQDLFNARKAGMDVTASPSTPAPRKTVGKTAALSQAVFDR